VVASRRLAAALLLVSGITHVGQLAVYDADAQVMGAAAFGVVYFCIGLLLLRPARTALWLGAILPAIGGLLGVYRLVYLHCNPFSVFHVAIDLVVVPICIYWLVEERSVGRGAS
jgi:hypothetical protein